MGYEQFIARMDPVEVTLAVGSEELKLKVKGIPWSRKNQIRSQSVRWNDKGETVFDGDFYLRECLKAMIAEAPWGATTDVFLSQINDDLGSALQKLVPSAFGASESSQDLSQVKKE